MVCTYTSIIFIINNCIYIYIYIATTLIAIGYIVRKVNSNNQHAKYAINGLKLASMNLTNESALIKYLTEFDNFTKYMKHLAKEVSEEIMLFSIEVTQFKTRLQNEMEIEPNGYQFPIKLPLGTNKIPKSAIVYNDNNNNNDIINENEKSNSSMNKLNNKLEMYIEIGLKIYNKYCKVGSEFEINISNRRRNHLTAIFGDSNFMKNELTIDILYHAFDASLKEMERFIRQSFHRFVDLPDSDV